MDPSKVNPPSLIRKPMSTPKPERLYNPPSPSTSLSQDILKLAETLFATRTNQIMAKEHENNRSINKSVSFNLLDSSHNLLLDHAKSPSTPNQSKLSPPNSALSKSLSHKDSVTPMGPFVRLITQRNGTLVHLGQLVGIIHDHSALLLQHVISLDPSRVSQALIRDLKPQDILALIDPRTESEQARRTSLLAQINQGQNGTENEVGNCEEKSIASNTTPRGPILAKSELLLVRIDEICDLSPISNKNIDFIQPSTSGSEEGQLQLSGPETCSSANGQQNQISSTHMRQSSTMTTEKSSETLDTSTSCTPTTSYRSEPTDKLAINETVEKSECCSNNYSNKKSQRNQSCPPNFRRKTNSTKQKIQPNFTEEDRTKLVRADTNQTNSQRQDDGTNQRRTRRKQNKNRSGKQRRHSIEVVEYGWFTEPRSCRMTRRSSRSVPQLRQSTDACLDWITYAKHGSCPSDPAIVSIQFHPANPDIMVQSRPIYVTDTKPYVRIRKGRNGRLRCRTHYSRW